MLHSPYVIFVDHLKFFIVASISPRRFFNQDYLFFQVMIVVLRLVSSSPLHLICTPTTTTHKLWLLNLCNDLPSIVSLCFSSTALVTYAQPRVCQLLVRYRHALYFSSTFSSLSPRDLVRSNAPSSSPIRTTMHSSNRRALCYRCILLVFYEIRFFYSWSTWIGCALGTWYPLAQITQEQGENTLQTP